MCFWRDEGKGMKKKYSVFSRLLSLLTAAFLCAVLLGGCKGAGSEENIRTAAVPQTEEDKDVEPLKEHNDIPEDGTVTKAQMGTIAGKEGTYYFDSETEDGVTYQWAYEGEQIQNPIEQKLKVECASDGLKDIQKAAGNAPYGLGVVLQDMEMAAPAKLTLTLTEKWKADKVLFCTYEDGKIYQLAQGQIDQVKEGKKKVSRISFPVTKAGDTFYLVGGSTKGEKGQSGGTSAKSKNQSGTSGNAATGEKSGSGSGAAQAQLPGQGAGDSSQHASEGGGEVSDGENPADGWTGDGQQEIPGDGSGGQQTDGGQGETHTCTISIECSTLLNNWDRVEEAKKEFVPSDGWIFQPAEVTYTPGETVFDVLKRVCADAGIQMESRYTPMYGSYYIEGMNQLYEFDGGPQSGWMYSVNSWFPNYGCSSYTVNDGDVIEWRYTCDLGSDVGNVYMGDES